MNTLQHCSNPRRPAVIAHRGDSAHAPENTLAAFRKAIETGADWMELDTLTTRDGQLVVFHDRDLHRFANSPKKVIECSTEEMRALDVGAWFSPDFAGERVPMLDDVFELAAGRIGVYVELKSTEDETPFTRLLLERLADWKEHPDHAWPRLEACAAETGSDSLSVARAAMARVRRYRSRCRIVVQAFSPFIAAAFAHEAPDIRFEFLGMELPDRPESWEDFVQFGELLGVQGFNINKESVTAQRLARLRKHGRTCAVWVVDEEAHMRALTQLGVDALITNVPARCLAIVQEESA